MNLVCSNRQSFRYGFLFGLGLLLAQAVIDLVEHTVDVGIMVVANTLDVATDNSDLNGWKRSGFRVFTDYGTAVQYLITPSGAAVPRINPDGKTILSQRALDHAREKK